jgi:Flp pilus assembly protein TadD
VRFRHDALAPFVVLAVAALLAPTAQPQQAQAARFQGKVVDASGQPVADATVHLEPEDGAGIKNQAKTRKKGDFILGLVRPGNYSIRVEAPGGQVITSVKARSAEIGAGPNDEPDYDIDQPVGPDAPIKLEFKDGHLVTAEFVVGAPSQAAPARSTGGGDPLAAIVEKVQAGDCAGALPLIEAARTETPDNARAHYLAAFCLERSGDHEGALSAIDRTLAVQADFAGGQLLRGRALRGLGRLEEAEAALRQEAETTAHEAVRIDAWGALAVLYKEANRLDDAIAAFEKVAELQPTRGEVYTELSALHAKKGDKAKAAEVLERAKQSGATADPVALLNVGIGYMNEQNYAAAMEVFRKVIDTPGVSAADQGMAWGLLGRCQLNNGQMEEGAASLEKALELDPGGSMAEENRQILAELKPKK